MPNYLDYLDLLSTEKMPNNESESETALAAPAPLPAGVRPAEQLHALAHRGGQAGVGGDHREGGRGGEEAEPVAEHDVEGEHCSVQSVQRLLDNPR